MTDNNVRVQPTDNGRGVFAARDLLAGEVVVVGRSAGPAAARGVHTIQVGFDAHVEIADPARLLNHCCDPNTGVRDNAFGAYDFIALRAIARSQEITFDYATTEYDAITMPPCMCGAGICRGEIRGFRWLPAQDKRRYGVFIAAYLRAAPPLASTTKGA
ncbi:Proteins containing SET domain protein [Enhygromyxa salina]|uniref:Proteins containing SET domain protein n=1 Tax=Enhygromyxa salina TaxID=215803 RepID=A0A0C2D1B2_9BACT|nr:SET domain-containing protein [Enhygromyxa salina]KIG15610.1 Proteins containing SET domain protein [Enhygromyxa salina]